MRLRGGGGWEGEEKKETNKQTKKQTKKKKKKGKNKRATNNTYGVQMKIMIKYIFYLPSTETGTVESQMWLHHLNIVYAAITVYRQA